MDGVLPSDDVVHFVEGNLFVVSVPMEMEICNTVDYVI